MLINLTNHPSSQWEEAQLQAAEQFGECVDMPFPAIDPNASSDEIDALAEEYFSKIKELARESNSTPVVHLMGEMTFLFSLGNKLKDSGIRAVASTSIRSSIDLRNGQKKIEFNFVRFRDYYLPQSTHRNTSHGTE